MTRRSDGPKEGGGHEEAAGGVADPAARVAAGAFAQTYAGRAGNHWGDNVVLPNANGPYSGPFDVFALKSGAGSGGADLLKKETKTAAVAASLQSFTYDDDGNMLSDGIWTYSWDAENRLTSLTATSLAVAGGYPNLQLEFKYDYLGRRIEKKVTNLGANGGVIDWRRFLYDGWSLIAEYAVSTSPTFTLTLTRSYTWGLDIARSLKDAGGVGALLQITDVVSTKTYLPTYDGNGNIVSLLNGSSGALAAVYEYSPYGEHLRAETIDSTIANNPFRFSTKYYDAETGLYDYGRRYYNTRDGRFLGCDPIEEQGGVHLYAFCVNNPSNRWDYLGMTPGDTRSYTYTDDAGTWEVEETEVYDPAAGGTFWEKSEPKLISEAKKNDSGKTGETDAPPDSSPWGTDPDAYGGTMEVSSNRDGSVRIINWDGDGSSSQTVSNTPMALVNDGGSFWLIDSVTGQKIPAGERGLQDLTGDAFTIASLGAGSGVRAVATSQIAKNAAAGAAFEGAAIRALGATKNTFKVNVPGLGKAIPDILTPQGITEIKNSVRIAFTKQLQIEAAASPGSFNLIVSPRTQYISQAVQDAVKSSGGSIRVFDPATATFRPWP